MGRGAIAYTAYIQRLTEPSDFRSLVFPSARPVIVRSFWRLDSVEDIISRIRRRAILAGTGNTINASTSTIGHLIASLCSRFKLVRSPFPIVMDIPVVLVRRKTSH